MSDATSNTYPRCARCGDAITTPIGQIAYHRAGLEFTSQGLRDLVLCAGCPNVLTDAEVHRARAAGWTRETETDPDNPLTYPCANCGAQASEPCRYHCIAQPAANIDSEDH